MISLPCVDLSLDNGHELDAFVCIKLAIAELMEATSRTAYPECFAKELDASHRNELSSVSQSSQCLLMDHRCYGASCYY